MRGYRNYESNPHPGAMREMIDVVREVNTINANGYPEAADVPVYTKLWASADDAGNQKFRASDSEIAQNVINFTIRHRPNIEPGMFVIFNGQRREIVDIGHYGFKSRYLGLKTLQNEGVTQ